MTFAGWMILRSRGLRGGGGSRMLSAAGRGSDNNGSLPTRDLSEDCCLVLLSVTQIALSVQSACPYVLRWLAYITHATRARRLVNGSQNTTFKLQYLLFYINGQLQRWTVKYMAQQSRDYWQTMFCSFFIIEIILLNRWSTAVLMHWC